MNSKSKSRSGRSKRSGSRTASANPGDLSSIAQRKKGRGEDKSNFFAMISGMVTTLLLIFGVFDYGADPSTAQIVSDEVAQRDKARKEWERVDELEELSQELTELGKKKTTGMMEAVSWCKERISVAEEILSRNPQDQPEIRKQAITEGLQARISLYGHDFKHGLEINRCSEDLEAAYTPYLNDKDEKVYVGARVAMLTHLSFEQMKAGNSDFSDLIDVFTDTLARFPENEFVASMIKAHFLVLIDKSPEYSSGLFREVRHKNPDGTLSEVYELTMHDVSDEILLGLSGFKRKYSERWANGEEGHELLINSAAELLSNPKIGRSLVVVIAKLGYWFERNEYPAEATRVFELMSEAIANGNVRQPHRNLANEIAEGGKKRSTLKGKALQFTAIDSAGNSFSSDVLEKKAAIVTFWSAESRKSLMFLDELNKGLRLFEKKPICVIAVCIDEELPKQLEELKKLDPKNSLKFKSPLLMLVGSKHEGETLPLISECPHGPLGLLPHAMLLDFGGVVEMANVEPSQAIDKLVGLLVSRSRGQTRSGGPVPKSVGNWFRSVERSAFAMHR